MILKKSTYLFILLVSYVILAQENAIKIKASLDTISHTIHIEQSIIYHNTSQKTLQEIYLHNWGNSFKDKETPLGKRLIKDYKKDFYFSKKSDRGFSKITSLLTNNKEVDYQEVKNHDDIIEIQLNKALLPKDSIEIKASYTVKIPKARYTGYGRTKDGYHLRFWYLTPAVFNTEWQLMSNLNMDDLYENIANYVLEITIPEKLYLESNLYQYQTQKEDYKSYYLVGKRKKDIILSISKREKFTIFKTKNSQIKTDLFDKRIELKTANSIVNKQIDFIENFTGSHPHTEILVDGNTVNKNSLRDIYGIPNWLRPYPENFKWEVRFFKALTEKYIDDVLLLNKRKDYWLCDGIQTFLMMEYINTYYPDITVFGRFSKIWGFKDYNFAKLKQNDKYAFFYQFSARRFFDQALTTRADSLSNFNRKVVSPYKAGLGFKYLKDFIGEDVLKKSFQDYYKNHRLKITNSDVFKKIIEHNTVKDLSWFFGDYINTTEKIDYKIKKVKPNKTKDSLLVTIKNKRKIAAPVSLYAINNKRIQLKKWVTGVDSIKTIAIKNGEYDKLALNYEQIYPEYNSLNNYKKPSNAIVSKPIQFRFLTDIEDPNYNQVFFNPNVRFNLYDGMILGVNFNNRAVIRHNFDFSLTPNYAFRSENLTGSFSFGYDHFFEKSKIYKIRYGVSGSNFHYAPELSYNTFVPFVNIQFRRNTLRDVGTKSLTTRVIYVDREINPEDIEVEDDRYSVLNFRYIFSKPDVIRRFQYAINAEFGDNFSKFSTDIRYLKFFDQQRSFNLRLFGGFFLWNNSEGDFFSFGLNRSPDYLFEQNLFGRSENSGLFSQQFIISDAGFKSFFPNESPFANQAILAANTSISMWKWVEIYNDAAMLKSKNQYPRFFYENGIRLNFVPNIFELYFPIYTNQGFEITKPAYPNKIRFIVTTSLDRIYNFLRRGIL
ncbi:gluzincin family metallopeptidase [Tenacibaculum agarivorans]|uniref:aminopeptidase n=1 Tax=Tenacibaculum agarivorans TaxID=1908389 RepID=UPI0009FA24A2|nr:aminopeptidase [Tenacibaculum agarivorans]